MAREGTLHMVASETRAAGTTNDVAHGVLQEAQQAAYRFPEGFLGFRAHVTITEATSGGTKTASGTVTVGGPRSIELALEGDETLAQWGKQEIGSVAGHRWPTRYEESDGRYGLVLDEDPDHPLGSQITFQDDPFTSVYRVANGRISQVTRSMGPMRFTITMQRHSETPDGRAAIRIYGELLEYPAEPFDALRYLFGSLSGCRACVDSRDANRGDGG